MIVGILYSRANITLAGTAMNRKFIDKGSFSIPFIPIFSREFCI